MPPAPLAAASASKSIKNAEKIDTGKKKYETRKQVAKKEMLDDGGFITSMHAMKELSHFGQEVDRGINAIPIFYVSIVKYVVAWIMGIGVGMFIGAIIALKLLNINVPFPPPQSNGMGWAVFCLGLFFGSLSGRYLHSRLKVCKKKLSNTGGGSVCGSWKDCTTYTFVGWKSWVTDNLQKENKNKKLNDKLTSKQKEDIARGPCRIAPRSTPVFIVRMLLLIGSLIASIAFFATSSSSNTESQTPNNVDNFISFFGGLAIGWFSFVLLS